MRPDEIRAIRTRLGLSEVEFGRALRLEYPRTKVREMERGVRKPSPQMIALMEALLRVKELEDRAKPSPPSA